MVEGWMKCKPTTGVDFFIQSVSDADLLPDFQISQGTLLISDTLALMPYKCISWLAYKHFTRFQPVELTEWRLGSMRNACLASLWSGLYRSFNQYSTPRIVLSIIRGNLSFPWTKLLGVSTQLAKPFSSKICDLPTLSCSFIPQSLDAYSNNED